MPSQETVDRIEQQKNLQRYAQERGISPKAWNDAMIGGLTSLRDDPDLEARIQKVLDIPMTVPAQGALMQSPYPEGSPEHMMHVQCIRLEAEKRKFVKEAEILHAQAGQKYEQAGIIKRQQDKFLAAIVMITGEEPKCG